MADECDDVPECECSEQQQPAVPAEKMGRSFWLAILLLGILVFLVVFVNYPGQRAGAGLAITKVNWTLQSYADPTGVMVPALSGTDVTAAFGIDGRVTGSAGCNRYFADYTTKDFAMTIGGAGSTRMACTTPGVMEQETAYLADLGKASSFRSGDSYLRIYDAAGKPVLEFVPG